LAQVTFEAAARSWKTVWRLARAQQRVWRRNRLLRKDADQYRRRAPFGRRQPELQRRYQAAEPDPRQQVLSAVALERAAKITEGLPRREKRIALMKWNDHMKEADIAAELGCTKAAVTGQVHEIHRKLIDDLGPYYPFAGDDGDGKAS
jgi:DNA-directed RNA polymerase specialized sigma24 family protein